MKAASSPLPTWLIWACRILGIILIASAICGIVLVSLPGATVAHIGFLHSLQGSLSQFIPKNQWTAYFASFTSQLVLGAAILLAGLWLTFIGQGKKNEEPAGTAAAGEPATVKTAAPTATQFKSSGVKRGHWSTCNILHLAPDAKRLWQFDAKGKGFVLRNEHRIPHAEKLPSSLVGKSWGNLLQPKLNVAWLPSENVFLRVVELPAANAEETFSMVELQLEKLSPFPVTQIAWTMQFLGTHQSAPKADGTVESLQTVIVVIASRTAVEQFMDRLERDGFLSDRLEVPMLDQLEAVAPKEDSVWVFPLTIGGQNSALVSWWFGGAWRNLSFVTLPPAGDRAEELKAQLGLLAMAGEVEGWLAAHASWHLVADPVNATEWEQLLRTALNEPIRVTPPPSQPELAGRSAARTVASAAPVQLQPLEFTARYKEQFSERLWLHALGYAGLGYAVFLVFYFCMSNWVGYRARGVEAQVAALGGAYTNAVQLKAKLGVLQERAQLKFAALDCWEQVAQNIPAAVTLHRWGFADGSRLALSGEVTPDDTQKLIDFYDTLRKAKNKQDNQPFFTSEGDPLSYRQTQNTVTWSFSLVLRHSEEAP